MKTQLQLMIQALIDREVVKFLYDAKSRTAKVHAVGITKDFNLVARCYTTDGWRMFQLEGITDLVLTGEKFDSNADGYKEGDRNMHIIFAEQKADI